MVMPNSRERFEAEFTRTWPEYVRLTPDVFNRVGDGAYVDGTIHVAFVMWQAGAAAERERTITVPDQMQDWKGMDGAIAFHLIERHANGWDDASKMMHEWLEANRDRSAP